MLLPTLGRPTMATIGIPRARRERRAPCDLKCFVMLPPRPSRRGAWLPFLVRRLVAELAELRVVLVPARDDPHPNVRSATCLPRSALDAAPAPPSRSALRSDPPWPMTISLCDSLSTRMASSMIGIRPLSSKRSTTTATPCGTSSRVFRRICSRTNSATKNRSGLSLIDVVLEEGGSFGRSFVDFGDEIAARPVSRGARSWAPRRRNLALCVCPSSTGRERRLRLHLVDFVETRTTGVVRGWFRRIRKSSARIRRLRDRGHVSKEDDDVRTRAPPRAPPGSSSRRASSAPRARRACRRRRAARPPR